MPKLVDEPVLIYVGDPMCSWCYGISEELTAAQLALGGEVDYELVVGGLRAGGGDQWNADFTNFLKHHWEEVSFASGQPFGYDLLDLPHFDYDTEPSCRAVVVAESMDEAVTFAFFKLVQQKFYVQNQDPKQVAFYQSICKAAGLDYKEFAKRFVSADYKQATVQHFQRARSLGANSFPTILLKHGEDLHLIARGFAKSEEIVARVQQLLK